MNLAYLTTQYPKTSHTFIRREILELERRGHSVERLSVRSSEAGLINAEDQAEEEKTVVCLSQSPWVLIGALVKEAIRQPAKVFGALRIAIQMSGLSDRGLSRHLAYLVEAAFFRNHLRGKAVEHLHVHFGTNAAAVARLLHRLGGPPHSITIHGPDEWDAPVALSLGAKIEDSRFVVTISFFGSGQTRRWTRPEQWDKIQIVRCAVNDRFFDLARPIRAASKTFLSIGRLTAQKGPLLLIDAMAALIGSGASAHLVLAGDGELRDLVERRIREHRLENYVDITGWVDEDSILTHIRESRCFILPSFAEGLPVVIMEALAMRRPVISTYVAGIPELVVPGENGWLVPAGDVVSLTAAMQEALDTPTSELDSMGERGAARVRRQHYLPTEIDKLEALILGRSSSSDPSPPTQSR